MSHVSRKGRRAASVKPERTAAGGLRPISPSDPFSAHAFAAGNYVEVVTARDRFYGKLGVVQFFVDDNIYVKFSTERWAPTRMFFPDQIRIVFAAPSLVRAVPRPSPWLRGLRVLQHRLGLL